MSSTGRAGRWATARGPTSTAYPAPARAEQDPEDWWRALGEAVRGAVAAAGIDGRDVAALACDTTSCTVVALDADGAPLRPCLLWMDVRAHAEAADVLATGDGARCGSTATARGRSAPNG